MCPQRIEPDPRAMEEWKQLQTIIGRLEGLEFQVRSWLLVLLGALIAVLFKEGPKLTGPVFLFAGLSIIVAFGYMELHFRVSKRAAINRVDRVESALRDEEPYDGPGIFRGLSERGPRSDLVTMKAEITVAHVWSFYIPLVLVVLILTLCDLIEFGFRH
jgi:hypothetical protein